MNATAQRRVAITGKGVISPLGSDASTLLDALRSSQSAVGPITAIPTEPLPFSFGAECQQFTGSIDDYGPLDKTVKRGIKKGQNKMCREIALGVAAAQRALSDAGLDADKRDPLRTGVVYGCDYIMTLPEEFSDGIRAVMNADGQVDFGRWGSDGLKKVNPLWLLTYLPNMPASHIAIYNDLRGPNNSLTLRESSAGAAVAEAFSTIVRGHADALVVGSTGCRIHPFRTMHASMQEDLVGETGDPATASRPFDRQRAGAVLGEGAAALILESEEHALARGANILGYVSGYGSSCVGPPTTTDSDRPHHQQMAITHALRAAVGDHPSDIGHINAHGLSTIQTDAAEAAAIESVFGSPIQSPPVTTLKGHIGNLGAGGGMVELVASLQAIGTDDDNSLWPILNCDALAEDCPIHAVRDNATAAGDSFVTVNVTPQGQATAVKISRS
ncbi:MAG: beta-ketoacyl-[acyl-carrier-protein] synthase family protein [Planctomycetota bacterium]